MVIKNLRARRGVSRTEGLEGGRAIANSKVMASLRLSSSAPLLPRLFPAGEGRFERRFENSLQGRRLQIRRALQLYVPVHFARALKDLVRIGPLRGPGDSHGD